MLLGGRRMDGEEGVVSWVVSGDGETRGGEGGWMEVGRGGGGGGGGGT